jgi:hypothetical protein
LVPSSGVREGKSHQTKNSTSLVIGAPIPSRICVIAGITASLSVAQVDPLTRS